ncbi:MAG: class I SAM-dependent methyltransferase [Bryobacteraceae bacterium]
MSRDATTTAEYTIADQERMKAAHRYFDWQASMAKAQLGHRVIEVGCGLGNFTRHLLDRELIVGLDVVPGCVEQLLARYPERRNLQAHCMDVQDKSFLELAALRPDSVVCLNVLEHVRDDLIALQHMHSVLQPGGRAVFILPAYEQLFGPIDENLGHFRRYSKPGWRQLAAQAGFRVKVMRYTNSVGFFGWWTNAKIFRKTEQSEAQIAFFDSYIVPMMSTVEGWVEPPFGQSIFSVLEKAPE